MDDLLEQETNAGAITLCLGVLLAAFGWLPPSPWDVAVQTAAGVLVAAGAWLLVRGILGLGVRDDDEPQGPQRD